MVIVLVSVVLGVISFGMTQPNNDSISLKTPSHDYSDDTSIGFISDWDNPTFAAQLTNNGYTFFSVKFQHYTCNDNLTTCSLVK